MNGKNAEQHGHYPYTYKHSHHHLPYNRQLQKHQAEVEIEEEMSELKEEIQQTEIDRYNNDNADIIFRTKTNSTSLTEVMTLKGSGKVDIGTASPAESLEIFISK
jgi:hypothetical protein